MGESKREYRRACQSFDGKSSSGATNIDVTKSRADETQESRDPATTCRACMHQRSLTSAFSCEGKRRQICVRKFDDALFRQLRRLVRRQQYGFHCSTSRRSSDHLDVADQRINIAAK